MSAAPRSKPGPKPGTVVARAKVDWDALEPHYRAGVRTVAAIAAEFGCTDVAVVKHAKKFGWTRNLKAKIEAKAQAKIAAALVAEVNPQARMSEAVRVEVEAEVQARILQSQRADIVRYRDLGMQMFAELQMQTTAPDVLYQLAAQTVELDEPDDPPDVKKQRAAERQMRVDLIGKAVALPSRVSSYKAMAEALRIVVLLQRQAIGLGSDESASELTRGGVVYRANMPQRGGIVEANH